MFISLAVVTAVWLIATFITRPTDREKLKSFYRLVRPAGVLWKPISEELASQENIKPTDNLKIAFIGWLFSNPMTFGFLFGTGKLLFGETSAGIFWLAVGFCCAVVTVWSVKKIVSVPNDL